MPFFNGGFILFLRILQKLTLTSGECTDQGNALLWTELIPSVLQTLDGAVSRSTELRGAYVVRTGFVPI